MNREIIPFNYPYTTGKEFHYITQSLLGKRLAGDGPFTKRCSTWLEQHTNRALLTHSCTAALEIGSLLLNIKPGDEIIMPSYTFVSTANAFVLRGGIPVFIDIRKDTLNMDESKIEAAITSKTKAIVPVHYAGVSCEMDAIMNIAKQHNLHVIEDAAQGVMATYKEKSLGSIGHLGAYSFHETKNIISGEGGALLVNDPSLTLEAEIIREKGTDRSQFLRGEVDKYTWQTIGSSFLPSEMIAAFLWAQLEEADKITKLRLDRWNYYHEQLLALERAGVLRRPIIPTECQHNAHMYYVLLAPEISRQMVLESLKQEGIHAASHYVPLHSSKAGKRYGKTYGSLALTDSLSARIIRLPLWVGLSTAQQDRVVEQLAKVLNLVSS